ncbi:MAG: hypothetical protein FJW39_01380 [Acidobacteria bacterium]|nr:hypothetical protein [Acidobacteriota bacterium]
MPIEFAMFLAIAAQPGKLLADDSLLRQPKSLRTVAARTSTVYRAEAGKWQFNLHSYVTHFEGRFWAMWSSGQVDEDSSSQLIRYATSSEATPGHRRR